MKLADMTIKTFTETLGSNAPAPGGGSASAVAGAMGIALGAMVASLTVGRKKYAEYEDEMKAIIEKAQPIIDGMVVGIDTDTDAFNGVTAAFAMPKDTDEQKKERSAAIQEAYKKCTIVPFELIERCEEALLLIMPMIGKFNTNAASDLGVAALNLKSAALGAWLNVLINLSGIKDEEFVKTYKENGQKLVDSICKMSDELYNHILTVV